MALGLLLDGVDNLFMSSCLFWPFGWPTGRLEIMKPDDGEREHALLGMSAGESSERESE